MVSELHVYKEGYRSFGNLYRSDEIESLQVSLKKVEEMTIHLNGVETEGKGGWSNGGYGSYEKKADPKDITPFDGKDMITFVTFTPIDPNFFTGEDVAMMFTNYDDEGNLVSTIENAAGINPLELNVTASVMDNETGATLGHISYVFTLGEGEKDIYVYIPVVTNLGSNEYIDPSEAEELTNMLVNAGITPVSTTAAS